MPCQLLSKITLKWTSIPEHLLHNHFFPTCVTVRDELSEIWPVTFIFPPRHSNIVYRAFLAKYAPKYLHAFVRIHSITLPSSPPSQITSLLAYRHISNHTAGCVSMPVFVSGRSLSPLEMLNAFEITLRCGGCSFCH